MTISAYPLCWPEGWPREKYTEWSRFKVTPGKARDGLLAEIDRLGGTNTILSTNIELRLDGLPYANRRDPCDCGVAVYFTYQKRPMVFACDKWATIPENMQSIKKTIEALRGIERWGASDMMQRAFTGFEALPDQSHGSWWAVLGVAVDAGVEEVELAYKRKRRDAHPDKEGGSSERFAAVQDAWMQYQEAG